MTDLEIWESIQKIRNTVIQAHVQINYAMDQLEGLLKKIQEENLRKNVSN